jgi:predicted short-subunit dehydrogenase-like oxidoreductase (DUF2520 family)
LTSHPIAIVGPGRLGQALGRVLNNKGFRVAVVAGRRLDRVRAAARFIGCKRAVRLDDPALAGADVILLTVSDGAVKTVARELAGLRKNWSGKIVMHVSGSLPVSVLDPLRQRRAAVGSLHPYQTVPSPAIGAKNLLGCFWAVEGDSKAQKIARRWLKRLGGKQRFIICRHTSFARPLWS